MVISILCALSSFDDCKETIVSSGMLQKIDGGNILTTKTLAISYLTMFGNISNSNEMRTRILNAGTIDKFKTMCMSDDPFIEVIVIKTIYSLSCAPENLAGLTDYET